MENKIQELTDKIYREGVEKGNEEARRLIANALSFFFNAPIAALPAIVTP